MMGHFYFGEGMKEIKLYGGLNAIVDDEDFERVNAVKWGVTKKGEFGHIYVRRRIKENGRTINYLMHRFILNMSDKLHVDHINGNGLDNRRENLRTCNESQNQCNRPKQKNNTTGFKGVSVISGRCKKKFRAQIHTNKETIYLGSFLTAVEAAKAYDSSAIKIHGNFAKPNFMEKYYENN